MALKEFGQLSDRALAELGAVGNALVSDMRKQVCESNTSTVRKGRDGKTYPAARSSKAEQRPAKKLPNGESTNGAATSLDRTPATAACPDTPEAGSGAAESDTNVVEVALYATMDQPPAAGERAAAEPLVDPPDGPAQENPPPASEPTASSASAGLPSPVSADLTVFRLADGSEVSAAIAEGGEVIPARKVWQALQAIVPRDADSSADRQACLRQQWLAVQLSQLLNDCARRFPPATERDLNADLKYAVFTLQGVKKWR